MFMIVFAVLGNVMQMNRNRQLFKKKNN